MELKLSRRTFLASASAVALAGCRRKAHRDWHFDGELTGPSLELGHVARNGRMPEPTAWEHQDVVIVGGGVAGLSAAWRLAGAGFRDFTLLELEDGVGGTSRSGRNGISAYPLAAHYVPAPTKDVMALVRLLDEAGVIEGYDAQGEPVFEEHRLVRSPEERLFYAGQWWEGLYLHAGESAEDQRQYAAFFREVDRWATWRDAKGRRAFTLPRSKGSDASEVQALDGLSFAAWLDERGLMSERLRWMLDYGVRDDYGAKLDTTSAWAGLFYYVARKQGPGEDTRPYLTWPEGNGFLVEHLRQKVAPHVRTSHAVWNLRPTEDGWEIRAWDAAWRQPVGIRAKRVIFAGSMSMAGRLVPAWKETKGVAFFDQFMASPWIVANLTLRDRPKEYGFPLAWDNVLRESAGLGYVVATHQSLRDHGPTVLTYYHALTGPDIRKEWMRLAAMSWSDVATLVMEDLTRAHPDLPALVTRLDASRWAHAMCRPRPGLVWSPDLIEAQKPFRGLHMAHHDLSGFALFEESQDHGLRAAEDVLAALGQPTPTWR